jgi:3-phosphoshikimate 1-carboxyvinyltransferase
MHERPQAALFQALRELGYRIDSPNDKLPAVAHGAGPQEGKCRVSIAESSQFASALILCSTKGHWSIEISGSNKDEQAYVSMTRALIRAFPSNRGVFQIEPDASSGSYFLGAGWLLNHTEIAEQMERSLASKLPGPAGPATKATQVEWSRVTVARWPTSGLQIDAGFLDLVAGKSKGSLSENVELPRHRVLLSLPDEVSRERDLGDSIMTVAVLAPFLGQIMRLTDVGRLRLQETERVSALRTELTKCGAIVTEKGDTLTIAPSAERLHGAEIETYNDHRMAMCFAILGLKVPGIKLKNPACVKKTFPNFFQKLATPPPKGLGVTIRDARTLRGLPVDELFAE